MILDVPTGSDFRTDAFAIINNAMDIVRELLVTIRFAEFRSKVVEYEQHCTREQAILRNALCLLQQAVEFFLKARIADTSPYVLIAGNPSHWPKGCDKKDLHYSEFRTIDAQDLIRVVNTITDHLPTSFLDRYERLRKLRNSITHTVDKRQDVKAHIIYLEAMEIVSELEPTTKWFKLRQSHRSSRYLLGNNSQGRTRDSSTVAEAVDVMRHLPHDRISALLGVDASAGTRECPNCSVDWTLTTVRPNVGYRKVGSIDWTCVVCEHLWSLNP